MTRSAYRGRCGHRLGWMSPDDVLHPDQAATKLEYVDLIAGTITFRCRTCGKTIQFQSGRVDLGETG